MKHFLTENLKWDTFNFFCIFLCEKVPYLGIKKNKKCIECQSAFAFEAHTWDRERERFGFETYFCKLEFLAEKDCAIICSNVTPLFCCTSQLEYKQVKGDLKFAGELYFKSNFFWNCMHLKFV